ncbi:MAG: TldD/PmbA family protein [Thermoplasmata archaeon]|nr:TldD/PmbA family protein [Thermoplasmata archaeon]
MPPSLRSAEDDLGAALRRLEPRTPYAEVMAEMVEGRSVRFDKAQITPTPAPRLRGAVFRAWSGHRWEEAACGELTPSALTTTTEALARRLAARGSSGAPPGESPTGSHEAATREKKPVADFTLEDQIGRARQLYEWGISEPGIENAIVAVGVSRDERLFLATTGARTYQRIGRVRAFVTPLAIENGKVEFDFESLGGTGGVEVIDGFTEEKVRSVAKESKALLKAGAPPTGAMNVLLDPGTAGTFAHESFGHGTEADQFLRDRSYLKPILGKTVGPEALTLVDDGSYPGAWGSIFFDDEGHPSQRTVLVDHGRFVNVLHDRETAAAMHRAPTGNTRRADFLSRPFVRMTNTFVEPGDWTFDELLEEAKSGVVLQSCTSGIEDPLGGNMQIKVKKGHLIEHGKLGPIVPSLALSGKVLEFLQAIRGIGSKSAFEMAPGYCGKGHTDLLPVSTGGSYVLSHAVVGPA